MVVTWQGMKDPQFVQAHGWDFNKGPCRGLDWREYALSLVEKSSFCMRIWINGEIVWDYLHGWHDNLHSIPPGSTTYEVV